MTPNEARQHMGAVHAALRRTPEEQQEFLASMGAHHMRRQAEAKHAAAHAPIRRLIKSLTGLHV